MAQASTIEWTDVTWNPIHGCSKVSPGCAHCYAETLSRRYGQTPKPWTPENAAENVLLKPHKLGEPRKWKKPSMVFVNSMSDLFHELVPDLYIAQVFAVMADCPQHTFQVLTKRPERMRDLLRSSGFAMQVELERLTGRGLLPPDWPLPNVWLGTSIENRRFVARADALRETPAAVRFISAEPLLGPLIHDDVVYGRGGKWAAAIAMWSDEYDGAELDLGDIDWLIVGGESGAGHRRIEPDWVRDLRDACNGAGTAFFFKQWGGARPKSNGRELDGRTWDEMPEVHHAAV